MTAAMLHMTMTMLPVTATISNLVLPWFDVNCDMYKRLNIIAIAFLTIVGCSQPQYPNPHIIIETSAGDIEVELFPAKAPKTVAAFLSYIDSGFYTRAAFYRVLLLEGLTPGSNTGLIQGGMFTGNSLTVPGIPHESTRQTGLSHTDGTISLARTTVGSANTEFFICIGDQTQFDYGNAYNGDKEGFAAFGKVFKGMTIIRKLQLEPANGETFSPPISISAIKIRNR